MKLSVVTTLYHSAPYIDEFYRRVSAAASGISDDYEIIFVNDGSPDNSLDIAVDLQKKDGRVTVVDLSRNFGHHKAIMTGLNFSKGDLVFLLDSDLEEKPELLEKFYDTMKSGDGIDVVYGVWQNRKGPLTERLFATFFYRLINCLSDHKVPEHSMTVRLMTRAYVDHLIRYKDNEIFLIGLFVLAGFNQKPFPTEKQNKGRTTYSLKKKIVNFTNALTSFSSRPLEFIFYLGGVVLFSSSVYILYLMYRTIFRAHPPSGYLSLMVSIWFLGGMLISCVGIIGIYISKIFTETKNRPYVTIRSIYEKTGKRSGNGREG